jgi:hypothetical protein
MLFIRYQLFSFTVLYDEDLGRKAIISYEGNSVTVFYDWSLKGNTMTFGHTTAEVTFRDQNVAASYRDDDRWIQT